MTTPKITVITPICRWGGIDIWKSSLQRQTFGDFEALLIDEHYDERHTNVAWFVGDDHRLCHIKPPEKRPEAFWNLSRSLNLGLALARGRLVVFYQDYIWLPPNALKEFWEQHEREAHALISGVGHKGKKPDWAVNLQGHLTIFTKSGAPVFTGGEHDHPNHGVARPLGMWFRDPRIKERGFHLCNPMEWEGNWSCAPLEVCEAIGGFDEDFDAGWGYDNVNFAERAQLLGCNVWLDEDNPCVGYSHERLFQIMDTEQKKDTPNNAKLWARKLARLQRKEDPTTVPYLEAMKSSLTIGVKG